MSYVSETSYIQCIVCIAAVFLNILHLKYFELRGLNFLFSNEKKHISIYSVHAFLLLVLLQVFHFSILFSL